MEKRLEKDTLGEVFVPKDAYWGASTQRSIENFNISGLRMHRGFIRALGIVKLACARVNLELELLPKEIGQAVLKASEEVVEGIMDSQFPVDVFQTGSGTHSNMNANEVIANRAAELLGKKRGAKFVHPNDHINLSQSSNDVIPSAMHISAVEAIKSKLIPSLEALNKSLNSKSNKFRNIVKTGRTHLMDAAPVTLGSEFETYAKQIENGIQRVEAAIPRLLELSLGGTAVGTGINAPKGFSKLVLKEVSLITGVTFKVNPVKGEGISAHDAVVELSGALKTIAVSLFKIANDLRWMASGPGAGLNEIILPANEPGSSIMPGKVNPTQAEALLMACTQVMGNDVIITMAGAWGNFELNTMKPLMAHNILQSIEILSNAVDSFTKKCVIGIEANKESIKKHLESNLMIVTALVPKIGYDNAAEIAKEAQKTGKSILEIALNRKILSKKELHQLLNPEKMA